MLGSNTHELLVKISGDSQGLQKSLSDSEQKLKSFGDNIIGIGKKMTIVGSSISLISAGLIKVASDAEETASKFSVVFQEVGDEAEKVAKDLRDNFGLSSNAAKQLLSDTGDLLTGFGFTGAAALDLSKQVNELAVDLASFTNYSGGAEGASSALTKALLGERESVKSLGISILETDVQAKVLEMTQKGITFETERQARAYATLFIAQEQSKNAIGDFARTSDSFSNQMRILKARISDTAVELGNALLPAATELINKITNVITKIAEWIKENQKLVSIIVQVGAGIGALAAVGGPILIVIGTLSKMVIVIKGVTTAMTTMTTLTKTSFVPAIGSANIALGTMATQFALIAANVYIWTAVFKEATTVLQSTHTSTKDVQEAQERLAKAQEELAAKLGITTEQLKEYNEQGYSVHEMQQRFKDSTIGLSEAFDDLGNAIGDGSESFQEYYERMQEEQTKYNEALLEQKRIQQEVIDAQIAGMEQLASEFEIRFPELIAKQVDELEKVREKYIDIIEASQLSANEQIIAIEKVNNAIDEQVAKLTEVENKKAATVYMKYDSSGQMVGATSQHILSAEEAATGFYLEKLENLPKYQHGTDYVQKTGLALLHEGEKVIPKNNNKNSGMSYNPSISITVQGDGDESKIRRAVEQALNESARQFRRTGYELIPGMG
jgi:hypothetical protein